MRSSNQYFHTRKFVFLMAMIAGLPSLPLTTKAAETVQLTNQAEKISGQVLDQNGDPVIGATIKVKGTTTGTVTDLDGNFTINAHSGSTLEVSYIGYKTMQVKAANHAVIKMQEDSKNLMCEYGDVCDGKIYDCCLYDKSFSEQMELIDEWYKMNKRY